MIEVFALGFAAGALSCLLVYPVVWPAPTERRRDARGRFAKERHVSASDRSAKVQKALERAARETGTLDR